MKKTTFALTTLICLLVSNGAAFAQKKITASNHYITKQITNLGNFNAIYLHGLADVEYTQSQNGKTSVSLYGADNILEYMDISVSNKTLMIKHQNKINIQGDHKLKVTIANPGINSIQSYGMGDVELKSNVTTDKDFNINITGTGDVDGKHIRCRNLSIVIIGTGDIEFDKVNCNKADMKITGTGDIEIKNMKTDKCNVNSSGTGDVEIDLLQAESVHANTSGTGDIKMAGKADNVELYSKGTGNISASNLKGTNVKAVTSGTGNIDCHALKTLDATANSSSKITYSSQGIPAVTKHGEERRITNK